MKKYLVVFLTFFLFNFSASASHFMGGEITWKCIKGGPDVGKYIFQMKVYRDCMGITFSQGPENLIHHNYPAVGSTTPILLNFISVQDISPTGVAASGNACFVCQPGSQAGDLGAVEEYIWESDALVLGGSPPAEGWHFTWGSSARNAQITNIANPGSQSWTLRAVMYPYDTDPSPAFAYLPANPCYDSSPIFKERAKTIICTGYPFAYSHNASDEELDEITYSWAEPLGVSGSYDPSNPNATALAFAPSPPYSVTTPIPGNPQLDAQTGEITYFSTTSGFFVTCIKVEANKCGQLVAEIYREVQVILITCPDLPTGLVNNPPVVSAPFLNGSGTPVYGDTVYAGDFVSFNIEGVDADMYNATTPQNLKMTISGGQMAGDYIDVTDCDNPPCATFNNGGAPPLTPPFSAPSLVSGVFEWQTTCDHLYANVGCGTTSNTFVFVVKVEDDFCPANGITIATIKIVVFPPEPDLRCVSVQDDGDIDLTWHYLANAPPTAEPFFVWHATNLLGPYTLIDSVLYPINTYTHVGANGNDASQYYFLTNKDGCDTTGADLRSDTLQSIFMNVTPINFGVAAYLDWNPIHDPLLLTSDTDYDLYLKIDTGLFSNYLTTPLLTHQYDAVSCNPDVQFYVEIPDLENGCVSKSSIGVVSLLDSITPIVPTITDVSVDASGKSVIFWTPSPGAEYYIIYLQAEDGNINIDTVWGELSSSYPFDNSFANQHYETFSIRAEDSCGNTKNTTPLHNSIYLEADLDACTHNLTLNWNAYINWDASVSHYSVVVEETDLDGLTTVFDANLQDTTEYVVSNLKDKFSYKIYIVANDGDTIFSAISNQIVLVPSLPKKPDFNYIEYASINHDNGFVEINCLVDNTAIINHYDVMRSLRQDTNFIKIEEIPFTGTATIHYTDEEAQTSENFYQYQIYPVDTCGVRLFPPPINMAEYLNDTSFAQTILLETEINVEYNDLPSGIGILNSNVIRHIDEQYTNTITFNEYNKWLGDVSAYILYRSIDNEPFFPLKTWDKDEIYAANKPLKFIDVVTTHSEGQGKFCYYIEAVEGNSTPYGPVLGGSSSNISCVSQTPTVFIPSAFTPDGQGPIKNNLFCPIMYYVSEEGYSFMIYNRSGGVIFTTNVPGKGWDGTFNGNSVQNGNYVYHLQYTNAAKKVIEKTDVITLVR